MNKIIALLFLVLSFPLTAQTFKMEIAPMAGYHLGGSQDYDDGNLDIDDSFTYGLIFSMVELPGGISVDLSYSRADSNVHFESKSADYTDRSMKIASNYIMAGVNKDFGKENFKFFLGGDLGAAWFDSKEPSVEDYWAFAFDLKTGIKYYVNERIGFRLQGRFLVPMDFSDGGMFIGIGSGGVSSGLTLGGSGIIYQGDFSAGIIVRL